jgi:hypothetical protein
MPFTHLVGTRRAGRAARRAAPLHGRFSGHSCLLYRADKPPSRNTPAGHVGGNPRRARRRARRPRSRVRQGHPRPDHRRQHSNTSPAGATGHPPQPRTRRQARPMTRTTSPPPDQDTRPGRPAGIAAPGPGCGSSWSGRRRRSRRARSTTLRRSRILEENTIDLEGIQFAGPVAVHSLPEASNQLSQLCAVIVGNHPTRSPSLRLARHGTRLLTIGPTRVIFPAGTRSIAWILD